MHGEHLLVVVADDGGIDAARNRGILSALERGAVCCTSLIANGPVAVPEGRQLRNFDVFEVALNLMH